MAGVLLSLTACYSDYVHLDYSLHHGARYNNDSSKVAFVLSTMAYRPAKGLAAMPDGGISEYLLEEVSIYTLDTHNNTISEVADVSDIANITGAYRSSLDIKTAWDGQLLYYKAAPVSDWSFYLENAADTKEDSLTINELKNKYSPPLVIDTKTGKTGNSDSITFAGALNNSKKVEFMTLSNILSEIPLAELGLEISLIYPKADKKYIGETIYLENTSPLSRRAVVEQIISELSADEIKALLTEMDNYQESLEGQERDEYKKRADKLREMIRSLL